MSYFYSSALALQVPHLQATYASSAGISSQQPSLRFVAQQEKIRSRPELHCKHCLIAHTAGTQNQDPSEENLRFCHTARI